MARLKKIPSNTAATARTPGKKNTGINIIPVLVLIINIIDVSMSEHFFINAFQLSSFPAFWLSSFPASGFPGFPAFQLSSFPAFPSHLSSSQLLIRLEGQHFFPDYQKSLYYIIISLYHSILIRKKSLLLTAYLPLVALFFLRNFYCKLIGWI